MCLQSKLKPKGVEAGAAGEQAECWEGSVSPLSSSRGLQSSLCNRNQWQDFSFFFLIFPCGFTAFESLKLTERKDTEQMQLLKGFGVQIAVEA